MWWFMQWYYALLRRGEEPARIEYFERVKNMHVLTLDQKIELLVEGYRSGFIEAKDQAWNVGFSSRVIVEALTRIHDEDRNVVRFAPRRRRVDTSVTETDLLEAYLDKRDDESPGWDWSSRLNGCHSALSRDVRLVSLRSTYGDEMVRIAFSRMMNEKVPQPSERSAIERMLKELDPDELKKLA